MMEDQKEYNCPPRCWKCGRCHHGLCKEGSPNGLYALRALKWAHCGKEGWMSDYATNIEIEDEGDGEFLVISQPFANVKLSAGGIAITAEEWPTLKAAIEAAFAEISKHNVEGQPARESEAGKHG